MSALIEGFFQALRDFRDLVTFRWKRLWCALDDHGGIVPLDGSGEYKRGAYCLCKRCGATVRLIG